MKWLMTIILCGILSNALSAEQALKVLHICFHDGCIEELAGVAKPCNLQITSWNIAKLPPYFFDPTTEGGHSLYNIDHQRAASIYEKHRDFFNQFDAIFISDTTALSRIFLQNDWKKPLIIWVPNRFDFNISPPPERPFPDPEYYQLLNEAKKRENVIVLASNPFEFFYARERNVDLGNRVIKPSASYISEKDENRMVDPVKNGQIFMHERTESVQGYYFSISKELQRLNIPYAKYRYGSLNELTAFKGIVYFPYQWCTLSFFETLRLGIPTFLPSESFLLKLLESGYFFDHAEYLTRDKLFAMAEWYHPDLRGIIVHFDSWEDLQKKAAALDYQTVHEKTLAYGKAQTQEMVRRWQKVFEEARAMLKK